MFAGIMSLAALNGNLFAATETILHSFAPYGHGYEPTTMIGDGAGNFYVAARGGTNDDGIIVKLTPGSQDLLTETVLHNFTGGNDGISPIALLLDASGNLFGLAGGGANDAGVFFELTPTSHGEWNLSILFNAFSVNNGYFSGGLAEDKAGNFYGTTENYGCCGQTNYGSVFELSSSGGVWNQNVLHVFSGGADGGAPYGRLTVDQNGNLYGTASGGGVGNNGLVFEFVPGSGGTWTENVLYDFLGGTDGSEPESAVVFDQSGNLYGTTQFGGAAAGCASRGCGTVFELKKGANGQWTDTILYGFANQGSGVGPEDLIFDSAGNIYGSESTGGPYGFCCGQVFELSPQSGGTYSATTLWTFKEQGDGGYPGDVILGPQGQLYGANFIGGNSALNGLVFELQNKGGAWTLSTAYGFPFTDGSGSYTALTLDAAGNLFGTTEYGGLDNLGSVFKMTPVAGGWQESVIYSFNSTANSPSAVAPSSVVFDAAGNLYGNASESGTINEQRGSSFQLSPGADQAWHEENLTGFNSSLSKPLGSLIFDKSGNLYGTAFDGGAKHGAVFELTPQGNGRWTRTIVYNFTGYPDDGSHPAAGLIVDSAGNFYGTTEAGGSSANCTQPNGRPNGCGTVFELQPMAGGGWKETVLYSFEGGTTDGASPDAPLTFDSAGNLFGTTYAGGMKYRDCASSSHVLGCGTVFELSPASGGTWTETVLHEFTDLNGDGAQPESGVVLDSAGNLYGTTPIGGAYSYGGTVYELSPNAGGWTETIVHSFGSGTDGSYPAGGLIRDASGNLYGTTASGGAAQQGTVYEITP